LSAGGGWWGDGADLFMRRKNEFKKLWHIYQHIQEYLETQSWHLVYKQNNTICQYKLLIHVIDLPQSNT
jgi:hypothetical protein